MIIPKLSYCIVTSRLNNARLRLAMTPLKSLCEAWYSAVKGWFSTARNGTDQSPLLKRHLTQRSIMLHKMAPTLKSLKKSWEMHPKSDEIILWGRGGGKREINIDYFEKEQRDQWWKVEQQALGGNAKNTNVNLQAQWLNVTTVVLLSWLAKHSRRLIISLPYHPSPDVKNVFNTFKYTFPFFIVRLIKIKCCLEPGREIPN